MNSTQPSNPFVGLRPFESEESLLFFGRQEQTLELLQRLHDHHFVGVIGSSGSGKSSLIRAGLIPRLKAGYLVDDRDGWKIALMKPGQSPLYNLASAFLDPAPAEKVNGLAAGLAARGSEALTDLIGPLWQKERTNVFLLADQFEELFRFILDGQDGARLDEANRFVQIILDLSNKKEIPFYTVLTMRSDFTGDCSRFYGLPEALNESQYIVPRLTRVQLRTAIEGPARLYGQAIDPALTARLLNDLGMGDDELPLLEHGLMRVWDHHHAAGKTGALDFEDYTSVGGIEKALSNHADEALKGMTDNELTLTRQIFQALTAVDVNGRKIRKPARLGEIVAITGASGELLLRLAERFVADNRSFLIISPTADPADPLIDISHESLIRQWTTLGGWVDQEAESGRAYLRLVESTLLYQTGKKDLMTGIELQLASQWARDFHPTADWSARYSPHFADSMKYLVDSQQQADLASRRSRSQRKRKLILLVLLPAAFVLLISLLGLGYLNNRKQTRLREAYRLVTLGLYQLEDNPTASLRIVQSAMALERDSLILSVASRIYQNNIFYKTLLVASRGEKAFVSADGSLVLTSTPGSTRIYRRTGMVLISLRKWNEPAAGISCADFSADGKDFLTGSPDSTLQLWNQAGIQKSFPRQKSTVTMLKFAPDGRRFLGLEKDGSARIWDSSGQSIPLKGTGLVSAAFLPGGQSVLTGSSAGVIQIWDSTGKLIAAFGNMGKILSVDVSGNGDDGLAGSKDKTAQVWALANHHQQTSYSLEATLGHNNPLNLVRFSWNSKEAFAAGINGAIRIWNQKLSKDSNHQKVVENWVMKNDLLGNSSPLESLGLTAGGDTLVTAGQDGRVLLWDITPPKAGAGGVKSRPKSLEDFLRRGAIDSFPPEQMDSLVSPHPGNN